MQPNERGLPRNLQLCVHACACRYPGEYPLVPSKGHRLPICMDRSYGGEITPDLRPDAIKKLAGGLRSETCGKGRVGYQGETVTRHRIDTV